MIKLEVTGGGGGSFQIRNANRADLEVSSTLTAYEAAHVIAEWLGGKTEEPASEPAEAPKKGRTMPPKDAA